MHKQSVHSLALWRRARSWTLTRLFCLLATLLLECHIAAASDASRTWPFRPAEALRTRYADTQGVPSRTEFLRAHGLLPDGASVQAIPQFTVSFFDSSPTPNEIRPRPETSLLNPDFHILWTRTQTSPNRALPLWDGRVYEEGNRLIVGGYSSRHNEQPVGEIDGRGNFTRIGSWPDADFPLLGVAPQEIVFDPFEWSLCRVVPNGGQAAISITREFLPIRMQDDQGRNLSGIDYVLQHIAGDASIRLLARQGNRTCEIARCDLQTAPILESRAGYQPQLQAGCTQPNAGPVVTLSFQGQWAEAKPGEVLVLPANRLHPGPSQPPPSGAPEIDGDFQDWRNIPGLGDPSGDHVSYLHPNPDVDLLEIKVTNDERHLYFYSRVAGAHGRTGDKGRYYWYAYIDVDRNPATGYPPTRDDNCYFGVDIGDDCEAQFEFVGNRFIKTFFGFTGAGTEEAVLQGKLTLGPSFYSPRDPLGNRRDRYKVEYVNRNGSRTITHDHTAGTSQDIVMALSPDGSQVEVRVALAGFLQDTSGKQLLVRGQTIDLAIGAECSSDFYGSDRWGADSTRVIYAYLVK